MTLCLNYDIGLTLTIQLNKLNYTGLIQID